MYPSQAAPLKRPRSPTASLGPASDEQLLQIYQGAVDRAAESLKRQKEYMDDAVELGEAQTEAEDAEYGIMKQPRHKMYHQTGWEEQDAQEEANERLEEAESNLEEVQRELAALQAEHGAAKDELAEAQAQIEQFKDFLREAADRRREGAQDDEVSKRRRVEREVRSAQRQSEVAAKDDARAAALAKTQEVDALRARKELEDLQRGLSDVARQLSSLVLPEAVARSREASVAGLSELAAKFDRAREVLVEAKAEESDYSFLEQAHVDERQPREAVLNNIDWKLQERTLVQAKTDSLAKIIGVCGGDIPLDAVWLLREPVDVVNKRATSLVRSWWPGAAVVKVDPPSSLPPAAGPEPSA